MTGIQPITGSIPGAWPILDDDTPIFNAVALDLGLITLPESTPDTDDTEPDTGDDIPGGDQD